MKTITNNMKMLTKRFTSYVSMGTLIVSTKNILSAAAFLLSINCLLPTIAYSQLTAGEGGFSLTVCSDGTVNAWGTNYFGELGNGTNTSSLWPVQVSGLIGVRAVAAGIEFSLALKNDGTVWAWGNNNFGQLGNGTTNDSNTPVQVSGLTGIIAIACGSGYAHSLALKNDGTIWAWGNNYFGELGNGSTTNSNTPVQVGGLTGITAIEGGGAYSLALKNDSTVWAWGANYAGQLGNGTTTSSNTPVQVSGLTGITAIAGGAEHTLSLKNDGTIWASGFNGSGQLGNGTYYGSTTPVQVNGLNGVTAIVAGIELSIALKNDGTLWAFGASSFGASLTPVQVASGLTGIVSITAAGNDLLALRNDGTVWATGYHGNVVSANTLVKVDSLCHVGTTTSCNNLSVSAGADESTFFGYSGDQQVTHTAVVSGGTAPYTYSWSIGRALKCNAITSSGDEIFSGGTCANTTCPTNGTLTEIATCSGSATVTVRLIDTTDVCVTVTDANNCTATDCFKVMAEDARCFSGNSQNYKIKVCHHTSSNTNPWVQICIADNAVAAHLAIGDYVGTCSARTAAYQDGVSDLDISLFPNPAQQNVIILFTNDKAGNYEINLLDITGRLVKRYNGTSSIGENERELDLENIAKGIYQVLFKLDNRYVVKKLVVQ
ncbi:MAG TPA: T9SS type A sorting domain-containing protein [Chitinophagales bacterium]|nr:T9SS type A sorting domain-containing protein [Chitinophagales bacterium]